MVYYCDGNHVLKAVVRLKKGEVPGNDALRKKQIRRGWAPVFDSVQWRYLCG